MEDSRIVVSVQPYDSIGRTPGMNNLTANSFKDKQFCWIRQIMNGMAELIRIVSQEYKVELVFFTDPY